MGHISSLGSTDKKIIADIISMYDRQYPTGPDSIAMAVLSAAQEQMAIELSGGLSSRTGVVTGSAGRRMTVSMPENLYGILRQQYPSLLNQDIAWFKKNFPMFVFEKQVKR